MIVLHAGLRDDRFLLWGETPPEAAAAPPRPRGRKPKPARVATLPYDAGAKGLAGALADAGALAAARPGDFESAIAWLPTVAGKPLASSPLVAEPPGPDAKPSLDPWAVTALPLADDQVISVLAACQGQTTLAQGVIVGSTLAFWASALRFAGSLVARQQFLPGVAQVGPSYRARWEPVLVGDDTHRMTQLARTMPHACRALAAEAAAPPETPAASVLSGFVGAMVDHLVRSAVRSSIPIVGRLRGPAKPANFDSVHEQWLHALRSADGLMQGDESELARFADQVQEWRRRMTVATAAPFRLCFRLEEPITDDGDGNGKIRTVRDPWYVRYMLQAADDPSLLIPVADAWEPKGRRKTILTRGGFQPREYLLSMLGQASGLDPRIEESLKSPEPDGFKLDANGAHEFLTDKAGLLEQAGFGVLLPAWWTRKGTKLHLAARAVVKSPSMKGGSGMSLEELVEFRWEVALGDHKLSLAELRTLAKLKAPLVKVRGQWVHLSAEEIAAALDFWKKKGTSAISARDVVQMALGADQAPGGIAFEGIEATGWMGDLLKRLEGQGSFEEFPAPAGFDGTLRPYQVRGYSWLSFLHQWGLGACLADDMGLGKTIQTLAMVQRDWEAGRRSPTLLICPMSVVGNWQKEAARFAPDLPVMVHHGLQRIKGPAFKKQAGQHALVLSSYSLLHRDFEILKDVPWAGVILDEAQNIKNPQTKQAQAARSLPAGYRVALTGTPVENHVGDLWSIMEFLNPGLLGTQAQFKRNFFVPIQAQQDPDATRRLKRLTGPFVLRRLKTDRSIIADLPDKMEMKVFCNLTKEQASLYAAVVEEAAEALDDSEGIQRRGLVLALLTKLKQVCNHPAQFLGDNSPIPGRSGKLARLTEMLEEAIEAGDRALIFSQYTEMGDILRRHLQETFGREVLFLHGSVTKANRDRMVERFQKAGDGPRLFVLSLKAGGTGLNLTAANHVFHFDRWWNPAVENQATDRAFRIGQTKNVQVHKFLCAGTLEEKIDEMIMRKQEVAGSIVGSGENWLTELSTADLKELIALRRDAVGE